MAPMTLTYSDKAALFDPACWRGKVDFGDAVMAPSIVNCADLESYFQYEGVQGEEA
jgi:hypothetical protein